MTAGGPSTILVAESDTEWDFARADEVIE